MRISDWSSDVCSSDLLRGQLLAQLVIFLLRRRREFARGRQSLEPRVLQLREGLEALGDAREFFERVGLQQLFHRGEAERVVFLILFEALALARRAFAVLIVAVCRGFLLAPFLVLDRAPGGLFADSPIIPR